MYVLIDREEMRVRYRNPDNAAVLAVMDVECDHMAVVVMDEKERYTTFTDLELRMLYTNMTGVKYSGWSREVLENTVRGLINSLPETPLNNYELQVQKHFLDAMDDPNRHSFRYMPGAKMPQQVATPYSAPALTCSAHPATVKPLPPAAQSAPAPAPQAATLLAPAPKPTSTTAPAGAPKAGSTTGRVWEIADQHLAMVGSSDMKALRKAIVTSCEAEGVNSSTASVQFGKWRHSKGL